MGSSEGNIIGIAYTLDQSGLIWHPEIGDEVSPRPDLSRVSILVDPQGLTPKDLRQSFLWLPTVEQLVEQFEARQAMIFHAGMREDFSYEVVVRSAKGMIEESAKTLRLAMGMALGSLLKNNTCSSFH